MSKRHLELDADSVSMNRKSTCVHSRRIVDSCKEDRMPASGSLKRPRSVALKPFDFSLIKDGPSVADSQMPCCDASYDTGMGLPASVSHDASEADSSLPPSAITAPPAMILPFLFLGSQNDALSKEFITNHGITHILNASTGCPKSPYITNENFLRIPVNDSHTERLLPYFEEVKKFLDGCRKVNGRVLVHCLAGISRSPTLVIAYVMSHLGLSHDDAYRYVKKRRSNISPNFNFLGQLIEFESMIHLSARTVHSLVGKADGKIHHVSPKKLDSKTGSNSRTSVGPKASSSAHSRSPTTAFSKLSFDKSSPSARDRSRYQRSVIENESEASKRLKPSSKSVALNNDHSRLHRDAMDSESQTPNRRSVNFKSSEADMSRQEEQNVSHSMLTTPVATEHRLRKLCKTEADEQLQSSKRASPPARPTSIAISGLHFDFGLLRRDVPSEIKGMILSDAEISKSPISSVGVLSCVTEACKKLRVDCSHDLLRRVESACRSRSFNDIPAVAASTLTSNGVTFQDVCSSGIEAGKTSSGAAFIDQPWHRALGSRASNGSLSSVGSSSLHGSRELVQVS